MNIMQLLIKDKEITVSYFINKNIFMYLLAQSTTSNFSLLSLISYLLTQ